MIGDVVLFIKCTVKEIRYQQRMASYIPKTIPNTFHKLQTLKSIPADIYIYSSLQMDGNRARNQSPCESSAFLRFFI